MSVAKAESVAIIGLDGFPVEVEVAIAQGLPAFNVVGLPDASIHEARERVRAAITSSEEKWPQSRITVNLSPAHLRKAGPGFDLAIALGVLAASGRVARRRLSRLCLIGELSLDGSVRRVRGALASAMAAAQAGMRVMIVPRANAGEAALVDGLEILPVDHLVQAIRFLRGEVGLEAASPSIEDLAPLEEDLDLADVKGQSRPKRALEVAAAGGHNILFQGCPGGGKTMLARRLAQLLPPLGRSEALEVTRIYSVAGLLPEESGLMRRRPFRSPHQSVSTTGLIGGGSAIPQPGEVSLAHRGVLFLDEMGEFRRDALQALRAPLEEGIIAIVRGRWSVTYPARFQLVAATNPCPCGFQGDLVRACRCVPGRLQQYEERLSGPVLDRIDLQVEVPRLTKAEIFEAEPGEATDVVRRRVVAARERQVERLARFGIAVNSDIPPPHLEEACALTRAARRQVERLLEAHGLSARGAHRLMRVARTIADLRADEIVDEDHVNEAGEFKVFDRTR